MSAELSAGVMRIKNCARLWREASAKVKMLKTLQRGALLEVVLSKKCTQLWREEHFEVKMLQAPSLLDVQAPFFVAGAMDPALAKSEPNAKVFARSMAGVGRPRKICKDAFRVAGSVQETAPSDMLYRRSRPKALIS